MDDTSMTVKQCLFLLAVFLFRQEIARVAKKFRRLAERHGLESMITASNRLRGHLHAVVSRGVQDGVCVILHCVCRYPDVAISFSVFLSHYHVCHTPLCAMLLFVVIVS